MTGKIYTKKGDGGTTGTFIGRMSKSDQLAVALGSIDELNSWIGVVRQTSPQPLSLIQERGIKGVRFNLDAELRRIQGNLLAIGSGMAGSGVKFSGQETVRLEKVIDKLTGDLPKLSNFIYPTGAGGAAGLQVARAVARRAEREVIGYCGVRSGLLVIGKKNIQVAKYLNRLSDALFTMARWVNFQAGGEEEVWRR